MNVYININIYIHIGLLGKPYQFTTYPSKETLQSRRVAFRSLEWLREPAVGEGLGLSHSYCAGHISGL